MTNRFFYSLFVLLVLVVMGTTACQQSGGDSTDASANSTSGNIVFIRLDSITQQYTALADKLKELEAKAIEMESAQNERAQAFQRDLQSFQRRAQSGQMAPKDIGREEERLGGRQQALMQDAEKARQELQLEQLKLEAEFSENIKKVLKEVQAEFGYDYILNYGGNSGVAMVNDKHDITPEVVSRINLIPVDGVFDNDALNAANGAGENNSEE